MKTRTSQEPSFDRGLTAPLVAARAVRFIAILIAILILLVFAKPSLFFSGMNLKNIAYQVEAPGLLAMGLALVMSTGGMDLSLGATLSLCACVSGWMISHGHNTGIAIIVGLLVGIGCGVVNGTLVGMLALPSIIVTLGSVTLIGGIALGIADGQIITVTLPNTIFTDSFSIVLTICLVVLALITWVVLARTPLGELVPNNGWGPTAVRSSEPQVQLGLIPIYAIAGLLAAIGGILTLGRLQAADPSVGAYSFTTAIGSVLVGGAGLFRGGPFSIPGAVLGAVLVSAVDNELIVIGVPEFWQQITVGVIILCSLLFDGVAQFYSRSW